MEIPPISGTGLGSATDQDRMFAYRRDTKTGKMVEAIVAPATGEIVDQIPPEMLLRLQDELDEFVKPKETTE